MRAYRVDVTLEQDGTLILSDLPFLAGETVEVIILTGQSSSAPRARYPLRGAPISYEGPTEPVAEEDWEAAG